MPRNVRTARGDLIDFDTIIIKQQLAQAPMNIEVAKRKEFIDSKEGKARMSRGFVDENQVATDQSTLVSASGSSSPTSHDFEVEEPVGKPSADYDMVPNLPERKKK